MSNLSHPFSTIMYIINHSFTNEADVIIHDMPGDLFFWSSDDPADPYYQVDNPTYDWRMYSRFCPNCGNYIHAERIGRTRLHWNLRCVCVTAAPATVTATATVPTIVPAVILEQ